MSEEQNGSQSRLKACTSTCNISSIFQHADGTACPLLPVRKELNRGYLQVRITCR